jgi:DNA polymerase-3 subunit beta
MKLAIERNHFLTALNHSQGVVEKRTTLPILSHIMLHAEGVNLKLTSTDLEVSLIETVSADIKEPGKATVPAHLLHDIVRKLRDGSKVELELNKTTNQLHVSSGRSEFKLPCLPAEDFPAINSGEFPHTFTLPARSLRHLIEGTKFAMSTEETRYFLNGIYLHVVDGKELRAVATDGHRLAQISIPLPEGAQDMPGVIISRKTVNEISKITTDIQDDVRISLSATQISFIAHNANLTARLIDGKYPDYTGAIPRNNTNSVMLKIKPFSQAVDRVATLANDLISGIKIDIENGKMMLSAVNEDAGAANEEIEVEYNGDRVNIGFNSKYLLDVAQQISGDEARVEMLDNTSPIIVRPLNDESTLYVLMPMRV